MGCVARTHENMQPGVCFATVAGSLCLSSGHSRQLKTLKDQRLESPWASRGCGIPLFGKKVCYCTRHPGSSMPTWHVYAAVQVSHLPRSILASCMHHDTIPDPSGSSKIRCCGFEDDDGWAGAGPRVTLKVRQKAKQPPPPEILNT